MSFICDQIPILEAQITAYNAALTALAGGVQSFSLDTGQTTESVTRLDLDRLNAVLDSLLNRYSVLSARCGCARLTVVRPAW